MDWLTSLPATGLTAVTLLVSLYVMQARGLLYVKSQVDEIRADRDARIAEVREDRDARLADKNREIADLWVAFRAAEHARQVSLQQNEQMLEGLETTIAVVRSLPTGSDHHG